MISASVLLAILKEWDNLSSNEDFVTGFLRNAGYDVINAYSYEDARKIIQSQALSAVVMISDWGMKQDEGSPGLMEFLKDKTPTYSLITYATMQKVGYDWIDKP